MPSQVLTTVPDGSRKRLTVQLKELSKRVLDQFEWNGKTWWVRFQSRQRKPHEPDGILTVRDVFPEEHPDYAQPITQPTGKPLSPEWVTRLWADQLHREAKAQAKHGWHLRLSGDGVEGWFDLEKAPKDPTEKNAFASFDIKKDGVEIRCQFHLGESSTLSPGPVAWDHRRGASAGLPTLGKRR